MVGESIDEFEGVELPQCKGMFNKRANVKFSAVVTPYSPTSGHVSLLTDIQYMLFYSLQFTLIFPSDDCCC